MTGPGTRALAFGVGATINIDWRPRDGSIVGTIAARSDVAGTLSVQRVDGGGTAVAAQPHTTTDAAHEQPLNLGTTASPATTLAIAAGAPARDDLQDIQMNFPVPGFLRVRFTSGAGAGTLRLDFNDS